MRIKKILSMLIASYMVVSTTSIVMAGDNNPALKCEYSEGINSISGENLSKEFKTYFEENGINVPNNSLVEIIPLSTLSKNIVNATALCLTTVSGTITTKEVLITFCEDETNTLYIPEIDPLSLNESYARAGNWAEYPGSWDNRLTVRGTAIYDHYKPDGIFNYYRPYGCMFYYTKNNNVDVDFISVSYVCEGTSYSWPGFENLYEGTQVHTVTTQKYNPIPSTQYHNTNYYPSNKVILLNGSASPGNYLTFNMTVDGENLYGTVGV